MFNSVQCHDTWNQQECALSTLILGKKNAVIANSLYSKDPTPQLTSNVAKLIQDKNEMKYLSYQSKNDIVQKS